MAAGARRPLVQGFYSFRSPGLGCFECQDCSRQKEYSLRISIIGAGKVGRAIGRAAFLAGDEIGDVVCTSMASATAATRSAVRRFHKTLRGAIKARSLSHGLAYKRRAIQQGAGATQAGGVCYRVLSSAADV